ncbi:hypothetical protein AVEN_114228-1 [Araneus ventricosus]|uniref:Uncharacterized protein n=1 Tax=Araneus ventricosus TaxID=182803 RepID=A0A4Y2X1W9_ARAVE|nr:hypothetical protein AVEN_104438-1 [Araneus ventricosus]GBO43675.1 hypothetical protein AVEN_114228-1 [Araneus ventricosus]
MLKTNRPPRLPRNYIPPCHDYLSHHIEAFGNNYGNYTFVAIRFKKPVAFFKKRSRLVQNINPSEDTVAVIDASNRSAARIESHEQSLLYVVNGDEDSPGLSVASKRDRDLLLKLIPEEYTRFSTYYIDTLYVLCLANPFAKFWKPIRRHRVFYALKDMTLAVLADRVTLRDLILFQHFKRNHGSRDTVQWSSWYQFLYRLSAPHFENHLGCRPSVDIAKKLQNVLEKSEKDYDVPLPPSDFYLCEITLDEEASTGVLFRVGGEARVEYVSPMIVSFTDKRFKDVNREFCNRWLPLYRSKERWLSKGLSFYLSRFSENRKHLEQLVAWLSVQTAEKYVHLLRDLKVCDTILGEI